MSAPSHAPSLPRIALVLGPLTALGPLATDLYLPALPGMEAALGTDAAGVQATLIAYFAGFGLAQLVWGHSRIATGADQSCWSERRCLPSRASAAPWHPVSPR